MMDINIIASCSPAVDVEGKSPGATSPAEKEAPSSWIHS